MMMLDQRNVAYIAGTIERPETIKRLVRSIRRYFPAMAIYIGDQSPFCYEMDLFYKQNHVKVFYYPYDSGVSFCRAHLVKNVTEPFLIFGDDDFIFTERTCLDIPWKILQENKNIGLVAGSIYDIFYENGETYRELRRYEKIMYLVEDQRLLITTPIDFSFPRVHVTGGEYFYYCDLALNFAFCRRDLFFDHRVLWDEQFTCNGEHENFFLQIQKYSPYKVVYCPSFSCDHCHEQTAAYERLRSRDNGWKLFGRKWQVDNHLEIGIGCHSYDHYVDSNGAFPRESRWQWDNPNLPMKGFGYLRLYPSGFADASENLLLRQLYRSLDEQSRSLQDCKHQVDEQTSRAELAEKSVDMIVNSLSWRLTKPLRDINQSLKLLVRRTKH